MLIIVSRFWSRSIRQFFDEMVCRTFDISADLAAPPHITTPPVPEAHNPSRVILSYTGRASHGFLGKSRCLLSFYGSICSSPPPSPSGTLAPRPASPFSPAPAAIPHPAPVSVGAIAVAPVLCAAVKRETLDCGGLMTPALEEFRLRGKTCLPVQFVERVPPEWSVQWRAAWEAAGYAPDWIRGDLVYHEACGIVEGNTIAVWDPTDASWRDPETTGPSRIVAVRIVQSSDGLLPGTLTWHGVRLQAGVWAKVAGTGE